MTDYYEESLTSEEYEKEYAASLELVFGKRPKFVYATLPSLDGYTEGGRGETQSEAYEDYLMKMGGLIQELQKKQKEVSLGLVDLEYTNVGEI